MKSFLWRIALFLPAAVFAVYLFMAVAGIIASIAGAGTVFYCTVYCKVGVALIIAVVAAILYSQARLSFHNE
ncbi:MAG: hypothetical protein KDD06_05915 [Phaeodactylibacter sp.]|nr:hypothetical protein [Phaeodactylibacter sp.]MCB9288141.1 hypothetical protein [Lewinellaceae bacterium]